MKIYTLKDLKHIGYSFFDAARSYWPERDVPLVRPELDREFPVRQLTRLQRLRRWLAGADVEALLHDIESRDQQIVNLRGKLMTSQRSEREAGTHGLSLLAENDGLHSRVKFLTQANDGHVSSSDFVSIDTYNALNKKWQKLQSEYTSLSQSHAKFLEDWNDQLCGRVPSRYPKKASLQPKPAPKRKPKS